MGEEAAALGVASGGGVGEVEAGGGKALVHGLAPGAEGSLLAHVGVGDLGAVNGLGVLLGALLGEVGGGGVGVRGEEINTDLAGSSSGGGGVGDRGNRAAARDERAKPGGGKRLAGELEDLGIDALVHVVGNPEARSGLAARSVALLATDGVQADAVDVGAGGGGAGLGSHGVGVVGALLGGVSCSSVGAAVHLGGIPCAAGSGCSTLLLVQHGARCVVDLVLGETLVGDKDTARSGAVVGGGGDAGGDVGARHVHAELGVTDLDDLAHHGVNGAVARIDAFALTGAAAGDGASSLVEADSAARGVAFSHSELGLAGNGEAGVEGELTAAVVERGVAANSGTSIRGPRAGLVRAAHGAAHVLSTSSDRTGLDGDLAAGVVHAGGVGPSAQGISAVILTKRCESGATHGVHGRN